MTTAWWQRLGREARDLLRRLHQMVWNAPEGEAAAVSSNAARRYLDPVLLARVGVSPLLAQVVVEGFLNGLHQSPFHGFSVEFAEHREYVPGDDLRYVDWALYARTDHYYVKRFEEETNLRCYLLVDGSGSMGFGTGPLTKWEYGGFLATCLAYLMLRQQDAVGLSLFGTRPGTFVPPRCRRSQLRPLTATLVRHVPSGRTDLATSLRTVVRQLKRRGLIVLISDLIDEPEATVRAIRLLAGHRHDVLVFHLVDAAERTFSFTSPGLFYDLETGAELEVDPATMRRDYVAAHAAQCDFYRRELTGYNIDYQVLDTSQPYDRALSAYLHRRERNR